MRWICRQLFPLWVIVWLNGIFLRLTVRDSVDLLAPLYYATPWPVLAVLTLPFVFVLWRSPKMVFAVIIVAHLFGAAWILECWSSKDPAPGVADLKVVQWNVDRPIRRQAGAIDRLRQFDADILTIAEPMPDNRRVPVSRDEELDREWARRFSDYQSVPREGNVLMFVRGQIKGARHEELSKGSIYSLYDLEVKGRALRLLQVDLEAKPTASRRPPLEQLATIADSLRDLPLIITGDFNTPRDSVHLSPLRINHRNAWEVAGIGGADTWPWPIPVLSLDQIWSNNQVKPLRCRTAGNWRSDHLWVEAEFVFSDVHGR